MSKILILCDGGLGNRLGSLIGGIHISKLINKEFEIYWPENNWCGCSFEDLFSNNFKTYKTGINDLFNENINNIFLIHENQTKLILEKKIAITIENVLSIKDRDEDVIYYNNLPPYFMSEKEIEFILNNLIINDNILKHVDEFFNSNNFNNILGIHLRKTDFGNLVNENDIINYINKNQNKTFFICSDDKNTEEYYSSNFTNVITNKKTEYTEKLNKNVGWNDVVEDTENRFFGFNINRSKISVIEGFIDLLILSRTKIITDNHSTFLKFAKRYSKIYNSI